MTTKLLTTNELLDALAEKHQGASDYRLSKLLHAATPATVGNWRRGRSVLSAEYTLRVAELLEWPHAYVVACVEHERMQRARAAGRDPLEETGETARIMDTWKAIANAFPPRVVSSVMLALGLCLTGLFFDTGRAVAAESSSRPAISLAMYYAHQRTRKRKMLAPLLERLKRWRTWLPALDPADALAL